MTIGSIAAIAHGATYPLLIVVLGINTNVFSREFITRELARGSNVSGESVNCSALNLLCEDPAENCQFFVEDSLCTTQDELIHDVDILVIYYCALGVVALIGGWMHVALFQYACERQLLVIRKRFFHSILKQEIGWSDVNGVGRINSRLNE